MPLATLSAQITSTGISAPTYAQILQSLKESFQAIYGSDVYVEADSQDGQWLATIASAIDDNNQAMINTYNAFSPTYAQGVGLSSTVKINGIQRESPSFSTAVGNVVGVAGSVITNGVVIDNNNNKWNLPASVVIPGGGTIAVTVTAQQPGSIVALTGTINRVGTPQKGWQSFLSTADATRGNPIETDATLRKRQTTAASLPSNSPLGGVLAALQNLPGVTRVLVYENATGAPDANGIPARSISVIIEGGDVALIAQTIGQKKTPGVATYGNTAQNYIDPITGIVYVIQFYVLASQASSVQITVQAMSGWNASILAKIQNSVSDYINSIQIGSPVQISRLWGPAYLNGSPDAKTYEITILQLDGAGIDVPVPFNKVASCDPSNVVITVLP